MWWVRAWLSAAVVCRNTEAYISFLNEMQIPLCDERWLILKQQMLNSLYLAEQNFQRWDLKSTSVTYLSTSQWNSQWNGNGEFYNDLVANPSGTIFAGSCAGLSALCWFGRKDSWEGSHRGLWVPAELPLVAMWGQELCEQSDALPPPTFSCWYHLIVEPAGKEGLILLQEKWLNIFPLHLPYSPSCLSEAFCSCSPKYHRVNNRLLPFYFDSL